MVDYKLPSNDSNHIGRYSAVLSILYAFVPSSFLSTLRRNNSLADEIGRSKLEVGIDSYDSSRDQSQPVSNCPFSNSQHQIRKLNAMRGRQSQ